MKVQKLASAAILFVALLAQTLSGQIRSGTVTGSVKDVSGANIAGAAVLLTNQETGIQDRQQSNTEGQFTFPYLPAGTYSIAVTNSGFAPYQEKGLALATTQTIRLEVTMKLSTVETAVEVQASAAEIQTESSSVSGATQARVIDSIPNITQNPMYYAMLQAGVQPRNAAASTTNADSFGIGVNGRRQFSAVGINGGRAFTNDIQLDGLPVMGGGYNEAAVIPNTEGLQEVRVISNNFSAEYGRGQGIISMSTKSGTNQFHGQGAYMLRNEALNANTPSNNANRFARNPFKVHELGGSLTGPIIKNKVFFSSSYHYLRFNNGRSLLATVPTTRERVGDFSQTMIREANGLPVPAQIFDPYNVTQLGPDLFRRAVVPNAVMTNATPAAAYMLSFYPTPNRTPDDVYNANNYGTGTVQTIRRQSLNNRIDYRRGAHSIYGSGGLGYGEVIDPRIFGQAPFNGAPSVTSDKNPYAQIGDTIVLSSTLLVDLRYGVTRINTRAFQGDKEGFTEYDKVGVPKNVQALMQIYGAAPVVNPNGYGGGNGGGSNWTALTGGTFGTKQENQASHVFNGSVTKIRGRWTHKMGAEFRNLLSNYLDLEQASVSLPSCCAHVGGNYNFEYVSAAGNVAAQNAANAQRGVNGAGMLFGTGVWWIRPGANLRAAFGQRYFAAYTQNDWRATSKLTINLGLRWDLQPGPTERYNRMSGYDFTVKNAFGTQGAYVFPGADGYSRGLWNTSYDNWGPRFGAAYQITPSFVARGGFGVTYLPSNTGYFSGPNDYGSTPFGNGVNMLPYGANPQGVPVGRFTDAPPLVTAVGANGRAPEVYGVSEARFDRHLKNGQVKQWNFFLEKQFAKTWMASVGYSAARSSGLPNRNWIFQSLQNLSSSTLSGWRDQFIASNGTLNPANQQIANPFQPTGGGLLPFNGVLGGATIPRYVAQLPYPHLFGTGARINNSEGYADYHSLQARLSHAFSSGFQMDLTYTWSKELDYTTTAIEDGQGFNTGGSAGAPDIINTRNNRRYGSADVPHRFVGVMVYELPFGKSGAFATANPMARSVLGGWQVGAVVSAQGGMPFILSGASDGAMVSRPDRIAGVDLQVPAELQRWYDGATPVTLPCGRVVTPPRNSFLKYNACAFQGQIVQTPSGSIQPNQFWVGNAAQNVGNLRGPGRFNVDMSLRRTFRLSERFSLNLVADATNLLNSTQYSGNYNGGLGGTNLVTNASRGLKPGMGLSDTFGTMNLTTFDPRQITLRANIRF